MYACLYLFISSRRFSHTVRWAAKYKASGLTLSNENRTVTVTGQDGDRLILIGEEKIAHGSVSVTIRITIPRPNRYAIGVIPSIPQAFNQGFSFRAGLEGFGLHDYAETAGIYNQGKTVAPSTSGFSTGDYVTMNVNVDTGHLEFKVNGAVCAEMKGSDLVKRGVYLIANLYNNGASFVIIS